MLTRKLHNTVLHSPRRDSCACLLLFALIHTHTHTHRCIATHLSKRACPLLKTKTFSAVSVLKKWVCFGKFSNFSGPPPFKLCFSVKRDNLGMCLFWKSF